MIRIIHLSKRFGQLTAVDDLNLELAAGDVFGFIGPNGAGKTTTINILATLLPPTAGDAFIGGFSVSREGAQVRRLIGYLPENFGVYDDMTVREYLDFFAAVFHIHGRRRAQAIDDVLALTDLSERADAVVETLSRGMKQRLCLAKTLLHDPQVLLLDEPASGLDPRARVEIRELLKELKNMGKTILISSHILPELAEFCNKVGVIERGRLLISGTVEEVLSAIRPQHRLRLHTLNGVEHAQQLLSANPRVTDVAVDGQTMEVLFDGTLDDMADLLEALVAHKVRLATFEEVGTDLEEAFLRLTGG